MDLTHGSLFSGIGGFDLGFERAGIKTIWQVECEPYCLKVLEQHWPNVRRYTDVRTFLDESPERPDILSGGFPCQPVSHAGQRRGEADVRWLWPKMLSVVRSLQPRWIVAENVLGLVTHEGGRLLDAIYADLEDANYKTLPPLVVPACAFGAPHLRYRVWI